MRLRPHRTRETAPHGHDATGMQTRVLWSAVAGFLAVLVVGVLVVVVQNPDLSAQIWPHEAPVPRIVN